MILVTGATGHFGGAAIDFLLKKIEPGEIAALVRDTKKADSVAAKGIDVRKGDYFDYDSLVKAFAGVEKLLFVSSGELENRVGQHANVINAAKAAGVRFIAYTSILNPPANPYFTVAADHIQTERLLENSGITYAFLRNAFYFETIPMFIGDALGTGKIFFPAGDGKLSNAARIDMAEAAANVILSDGAENKIYEIGADGSFTFQDIANILSELAGREIEYIDIPTKELETELINTQTPMPLVGLITGGAEAIKHNQLNYPSPDLENLLGRKPLELKEFLKQTYFSQTVGDSATA